MSIEVDAYAERRCQLEKILVQGIADRIADAPFAAQEMAEAVVTVLNVLMRAPFEPAERESS